MNGAKRTVKGNRITTKKSYPFRSFYRGKKRLAFYVIDVVSEEPTISIHSEFIRNADALGFRKSEAEEDVFRLYDLLRKYFPKELANAILKFAKKDLKCKSKGFSLKAYINWRQSKA